MTSQLDKTNDKNAVETINKAEKELTQLNKVYEDIAADVALTAASMAPPPFGTVADVASIGRSLWKGDWGGALLDTVGIIPVVGDGIKGVGKGTKIAAKMDEVADAIKAAKVVLSKKKAALINGRKQAASKYWSDIKTKGKAEYDEAIKGCNTTACKQDLASKKGPQYKSIPKDNRRGAWSGERGDGDWVPVDGSELDKGLKEFNAKNGTSHDRVTYKDGFPDYDPFVHKASDGAPSRVEIAQQGGSKDFTVADNAMRDRLGDPKWKRPEGYTWHHTQDGATMELVPTNIHGFPQTGHAGGTSMTKKPEF